jgi:LPS-assembly lipoprotein
MMKIKPRTVFVTAALGLAGLGLGGCGFTPMYGAPGVTTKLSSIAVSRPDGRTGFLMGQFLDDDFGRDESARPLYRLLLKTHETRIPRGIRVNNVASRYEVDLSTTYTLINANTRQVVTKGQVNVNVSYDSADQPYAGIAAELDGQQRAAEQAADRIRLELASFFASPRPLLASANAFGPQDVSTYSERLQPATVLSPRERALGQPGGQSGATSTQFGGAIGDDNMASGDPSVTGPGEALPDPYANGANPAADQAPGQL